MSDLIKRLRQKRGTLYVGGEVYSIVPPATDPLRLEAAAELERLITEVERVQNLHTGLMTAADKRYDELTTENAALRADAERYRWLRHCGLHQLNVMAHYADDAMDAAIDSARAKESGDG